MKCFECDGCVQYELVGMDTKGKNQTYSCSNTDRRCYERLQFFNGMLLNYENLRMM